MAYKGRIDILKGTGSLAGASFANGKLIINEEQLLNDFTGTPTFTITYNGNSVITDFPTTNLEPYVEFIFDGIATGSYTINMTNDFGDNTINVNVTSGDEAYEVVNAIVSAVTADGTLSFSATNETGNIPGAATTLRLTSNTVTYRFFDTITIVIDGYSGFPPTFGTTTDADYKDFGSSPLISQFRDAVVADLDADGTIELSATTVGVGTNTIKFISEISGTGGNIDVDFSSGIGTAYLSENPLTLSGGTSGGTADTQNVDVKINGSTFASFTHTEGETPSTIASNLETACTAVGSGTYTFSQSGRSVEVTTTSTFATLSLSLGGDLDLYWTSIDVNEI